MLGQILRRSTKYAAIRGKFDGDQARIDIYCYAHSHIYALFEAIAFLNRALGLERQGGKAFKQLGQTRSDTQRAQQSRSGEPTVSRRWEMQIVHFRPRLISSDTSSTICSYNKFTPL